MSVRGWIGVDLDGTLAEYGEWKGVEHIGRPIPKMVKRVKQWLAEGKDVRIFTARVYPNGCILYPDRPFQMHELDADLAVSTVKAWCVQHLGQELPVTCIKDPGMVELWDDRAVQIIKNTGLRAVDEL
jgi:hypothetical protein